MVIKNNRNNNDVYTRHPPNHINIHSHMEKKTINQINNTHMVYSIKPFTIIDKDIMAIRK